MERYSEVLRRRARAFLESAKADFNRGDYDLVLFHVEQFLQLYVKYLLYLSLGDYPKTHSLTRLLKDLKKVRQEDVLKRFYDENLEMINLLEEAYITSRYLPREYDEEIARRALEFAEKALEVMEWLEKHS
ncbi:MAG: HEPN domain-containing protein [Thaumarchaeota archaeon]|nr:HEPN domain-containing protein [Nitrososphaerota archaeon]